MRKIFSLLLVVLLVGITGALSAEGEGTNVAAIDFNKLLGLLSPPAGFTAVGRGEGGKMDMGQGSWSVASRSFKKGPKKVKIAIIDGAYIEQAYAGFMALKMFSYETTEGYVKGCTISGYSGILQQETAKKKRTVMLMPGNRFLVIWETEKFDSMEEVTALAGAFDFAALLALK